MGHGATGCALLPSAALRAEDRQDHALGICRGKAQEVTHSCRARAGSLLLLLRNMAKQTMARGSLTFSCYTNTLKMKPKN